MSTTALALAAEGLTCCARARSSEALLAESANAADADVAAAGN